MEQLVSKQDFISAAKLNQFRLAGAAGPLMRVMGISKMNRLYNELQGLEGMEFIDKMFKQLEVDVQVMGSGLEHLPKYGPFITISNHPFGIWDGLCMMKIIGQKRPDYKVMANYLLEHVAPLKDYVLSVNPFESNSISSLGGLKQSIEHTKSGHPLGIFPAGEVSSFQTQKRYVSDRVWQKPAIRLIQHMEVPVIPVYFQGNNSPLFHLMGLIHPALRTAAIPSEMFKKRKTCIRIFVGKPISPKEYSGITNSARLGRYLRARTYSLGSGLKVNNFYHETPKGINGQKPIREEVGQRLIEQEIAKLDTSSLLLSQQNYDVYFASANQIPHILQELGRLREVTFREVGEGTGNPTDLDEYDLYYKHLFLWDREAKQLVGAYRVGLGKEIIERYGKKGFYTHSLFKMKSGFQLVLEKSAELGRSFIIESYQRKRLPLFLLWKGIMAFLNSHPYYQFLLGPVSISNAYSSLSKQFIVALIRRYYFDNNLAQYIKARKRYRPNISQVDVEDLVEGIEDNLKKADRLIDEMDIKHAHLPVLLKKYIKQNAKIIGFNIDPAFSNSLDGLMILDVRDLPETNIVGKRNT